MYVLELEIEGALHVQEEVEHSVTLSSLPTCPSSSAGCGRATPRAPARSATGSRRPATSSSRPTASRYMVRNDDVERATEALAALVEQELAACSYHGRP